MSDNIIINREDLRDIVNEVLNEREEYEPEDETESIEDEETELQNDLSPDVIVKGMAIIIGTFFAYFCIGRYSTTLCIGVCSTLFAVHSIGQVFRRNN